MSFIMLYISANPKRGRVLWRAGDLALASGFVVCRCFIGKSASKEELHTTVIKLTN